MKFDAIILKERSWAVPGLCGLLILHHDFEMPRSCSVTHIIWHATSVEVHLQYASANRSGRINVPTRLIATLYQDDAVGIRSADDSAVDAHASMLSFLAGEIAREASRWTELRREWNTGMALDSDITSVLSMASALTALSYSDARLQVEKNLRHFGMIAQLQLTTAAESIAMTPNGSRGVRFHTGGLGDQRIAGSGILEADVRLAAGTADRLFGLTFDSIAMMIRTTLQLPLYFALYLLEKIETSQARSAMGFIDYLPAAEVDFNAGDNLSRLSN